MTQERIEQIFELMRRKLEYEMAAVDAETELKRELMKKESDARIAASAASAAAASASTAAAPQRRTMSEEDDILGEVPQKPRISPSVLSVCQKRRSRGIFQNKFKPINLYCLRHMRGLRFGSRIRSALGLRME